MYQLPKVGFNVNRLPIRNYAHEAPTPPTLSVPQPTDIMSELPRSAGYSAVTQPVQGQVPQPKNVPLMRVLVNYGAQMLDTNSSVYGTPQMRRAMKKEIKKCLPDIATFTLVRSTRKMYPILIVVLLDQPIPVSSLRSRWR